MGVAGEENLHKPARSTVMWKRFAAMESANLGLKICKTALKIATARCVAIRFAKKKKMKFFARKIVASKNTVAMDFATRKMKMKCSVRETAT